MIYHLLFLLIASYAIAYEEFIDNDASYVRSEKYYNLENDEIDFKVLEKLDVRNFTLPDCINDLEAITKCTPSMCKSDTKIGLLFAKVKGFQNNKCLYVERISGIDGLDCEFEIQSLSSVKNLFQKRLQKLKGEEIIFQPQENEQIKSLIISSCRITKDFSRSNAVSLNSQEPIDPELIIKDLKEYSDVVSLSEKNEKNSKEYVATLQNYRSIVFTKDEIALLNLMLETTLPSKRASANKSLALANSIGTFYLAYLIYHTPSQWAVGINNMVYNTHTRQNNLQVLNVEPNKVKVRWFAGNLDRIAPAWRNALAMISESKFISKEHDITVSGQDEDVIIDFSLKVNQTFAASDMKIFEGKFN